MSEQPFRWCFIGTGTLAKQVAREITASGRHEITAVYSRRFEKAREFAAQYGGAAYDTAEAAVGAADVDGVYVVTPHNWHAPYVRLAVEAGKPVLCEKPFTTDTAQTRALFDLGREKGVYVAEAMWTWFSSVARQVKAWVDGGALGDIESARVTYRCDSRGYAPRLLDPNLAGGALLDIGVYPLTYLYRLFGKPERVKCEGLLRDGIDMEEEIDLFYPGGLTARASVSMWAAEYDEAARITGSRGAITVERFHYASEARLTDKEGHTALFTGETTMLNEFDRVAGEIRAGLPCSALVPPQATLDVMEIMDECRRQMGLVYPFER